ncbi:MAG: sulfur oxidation c-type cytochrome SoxA [Gammaproteobacteria bacterium]
MNIASRYFGLIVGLVLALPAGAGEPRSGYEFIKPATREMQDDDFLNPGMFTVEKGQALFNEQPGGDSKSCADCHGGDGAGLDTGNIARYPVYREGALVTLQQQISQCRTRTTGKTLPDDHPDLVALETFVRNRARGVPVNVQTDGPMVELLEKGEQLYKARYGLIDISCYHCHDMYPGQMIRGQKISEGQGNGFPAYRLDIGEITNLNQRIEQCLTLMRAEPFESGSDEINLMGLYIMSRSNGLKIETPAVRY